MHNGIDKIKQGFSKYLTDSLKLNNNKVILVLIIITRLKISLKIIKDN